MGSIPTTSTILDNSHIRVYLEWLFLTKGKVGVMPTSNLIETIDAITNAETADCDLKRENGNINGDSAMGIMLRYGSEVSKDYVLRNVIPENISKAHDEGYIHIHDLDFYLLTTTCCQIDLNKLFTRGFNTGHGYLREPQSITTAAALTCIAIQSNQNDQHGGQSIPAFDFMLAPYVKKSYLKHYRKARELSYLFTADDNDSTCAQIAWKNTEQETEQAMEAVIHNLNTMHSRAGAQVPFSSINYGTDTSREGRLVTRSILKATEQGMGLHETPIFPVQIFKCKHGVNLDEGDPNYDLFQYSLYVTGLRMYPNYSFMDTTFNKPTMVDGRPETEVAYMGCRTRVMADQFGEAQAYGRGNLSFTTINLPRLALENIKQDPDMQEGLFMQALKDMVDLVAQQLLHRYDFLCRNKHKPNFPFLFGSGVWMGSENLSDEDNIHEVLKHGTLSIGFIGLAECVKVLTGHYPIEDKYAHDLGLDIVSFMREQCDEWAERAKMNFTLLATPAEGTAGKFVLKDRAKYGIIEGVTDREYYTNSFHVPVWYGCTIAEKLAHEGEYHKFCNAGHISYVEVDGDVSKNTKALESIVKYADECDCGYFAINHPIDYCPVCGFTGIIDDTCPKCGRKDNEAPPEVLPSGERNPYYV